MGKSKKAKSASWREFEKLASMIERVLSPQDVVCKCPDSVKDLHTGRLREVDATIRYKIGSVPILITVECRERGRKQDDTWIEQLAKKKEKIGAAKTIAVASNGFSRSAARTAELAGIELRTISQISAADIASWCKLEVIHYTPPRLSVTGIELFDERGVLIPLAEVASSLQIQLESFKSNFPFLASETGTFSLNDVFSSWQKAFAETEHDAYGGIEPGGEPYARCLIMRLGPERHWLLGPEKRVVSSMKLHVLVWRELELIPARRRYRYKGPDGALAEGVEFLIPEFDQRMKRPLRAVFQRNAEGKLMLSLQLEDGPQQLESAKQSGTQEGGGVEP